MSIGLPELVIIGIICLCQVGLIAALVGGIVMLVRRSQKKE
jgi:hypothetical protein